MPGRESIGEFEQLVMLALLRLRETAYGMTVRREIEQRGGRSVSLGAVYATLDRLEAKGFVSSWRGEPTPERGGRAKKYFKLEAAGQSALRDAHAVHQRMSEGLRPALEVQ